MFQLTSQIINGDSKEQIKYSNIFQNLFIHLRPIKIRGGLVHYKS